MHITLDTAFRSTEFVSYLLRRCTNRPTSIYSLCQIERRVELGQTQAPRVDKSHPQISPQIFRKGYFSALK